VTAQRSHRKPYDVDSAGNHVCVVLLSGLGDVIHGLPVVNALKRADPSTRITWVVEPMSAPVLEAHPAIDEVVVFEKSRGLRGVLDLRRKMARLDPQVTLNCNIYLKSVFPTVFSGAPLRVGFDRDRARDLTWLFVNKRISGPRRHTQDMFLELLGPLGVDPEPIEWRLEPTDSERERQAAFFARFERPVAAIVPTSAHVAKDWIPERWAALLDLLDRDFGFATVLLGGPSDREAAVAREILAAARTKPVVAMGDGIRPLLWRIHGSDLLVAPDTGPLHMSRAMDVPVIGLYGHTNPWRVGPYRKFEDLWVDRYSERGDPPDPSLVTPKDGRMEQIAVRDVAERVQLAMDRYGAGTRGRCP
jgi:heptosyltransferase I